MKKHIERGAVHLVGILMFGLAVVLVLWLLRREGDIQELQQKVSQLEHRVAVLEHLP